MNKKINLLIAEDEPQISGAIQKYFTEEGFLTFVAEDGSKAFEIFNANQIDLLLLDWRMPKITGFDLCKKIRLVNTTVPIILLTALGDISNKVDALYAGADDYITKPFSFDELLARVNALLRRTQVPLDVLQFKELNLNLTKRSVTTGAGNNIHLTDKEFDLLRYFILNKGIILSKDNLCKAVWDLNFTPQTNICEVTVKNLRRKLEEITGKKFIKNVYGEGYVLIQE